MSSLYTATARATGGRNGHTSSDDGVIDFDTSIPKSMGGPGKAGATNPEQLFAAGYAACFSSAVEFVARSRGLKIEPVEVTAKVGIGPKDGGGFQLEVALQVHIPNLDLATATELTEAGHQVCPYSNATRGNVPVHLTTV
ncbi:organic hydroperoxide resistance protein [Sandaracinobacteroides saxicola]|uniref:Organic hydroperoxide resistance protein n=1 Tax=Sandaracinobacteroides saxicola TaxID=2759707 RepID=A0A7G5IG96_9SPHN|nr:organic hydroperoxide resistance protein [Sandaracinobacteroides saxicola]QMW22388.1 organic hydroperoxide resistance protein [Sandaracinobacteroides saxicola]